MNRHLTSASLLLCLPGAALAAPLSSDSYAISQHWLGLLCLVIFALALLAVAFEEFIDLPKSKPMLLGAGIIWGLIGAYAHHTGSGDLAEAAVRRSLLQYTELMLFFLVVMTYINALAERRVFLALRAWVGLRRYSYRRIFWITGLGAFLLSPLLDNLSTALLIGAIILNLERDNRRFIALACIHVVVAANAGGAYSPFGDITTLMVWQQDIHASNGRVDFFSFFQLFLPALISYLVPACCMHFALPDGHLGGLQEPHRMRRGAKRIMLLFLLTIATSVYFQGQLYLPGALGVMTGLAYLQFFGYFLKKTHSPHSRGTITTTESPDFSIVVEHRQPFDVFLRVARSEWDTLLFLCGVVLAVGGLGYLGFLTVASELLYAESATTANIAIGLASALLENIPTMSVVLGMQPQMSQGEWLLVTLSTGVGGSLLSIGSAGGVALMGHAKGKYTFFSHLKWTPAIALGFAASLACHLWLNTGLF